MPIRIGWRKTEPTFHIDGSEQFAEWLEWMDDTAAGGIHHASEEASKGFLRLIDASTKLGANPAGSIVDGFKDAIDIFKKKKNALSSDPLYSGLHGVS